MKISKLSLPEIAQHGFTHKVEIDYTDLNDEAGVTKTIELAAVPAGAVIKHAAMRLVTDFDGGATSELTVQVGDGGDPNRAMEATSVHADATEIDFWHSKVTTVPHAYLAADTVDALFTSTGANLDTLTQGKLELYLSLAELGALRKPE